MNGLQHVAGPSSLIGPEDHKQPLVEALKFPDLLVRSRAALALGNALPQTSFVGADLVVPALADAVTQTGRRNFLVIDPDGESLNRLMNELRAGDANVVGETDVYAVLERGRTELPSVVGIFLSTAGTNPGPADAVRMIRGQNDLARTPIVLLVQPDHAALVERFASGDRAVEAVDAGAASADVLLSHLDAAAARVGQVPLDDDLALELALLATHTLQRIAADGRTVLDASGAERALTAALKSVHQELQVAAIDVLALIPTATAQRSIADIALTQDDETLRIAAFAGLAESAKRFGAGLNDSQTRGLMTISFDESNLRLRTAASHALGALNLPANKASEIVRKYHRG